MTRSLPAGNLAYAVASNANIDRAAGYSEINVNHAVQFELAGERAEAKTGWTK